MKLLSKMVMAVLVPVLVGAVGAALVVKLRLQGERTAAVAHADGQLQLRVRILASQQSMDALSPKVLKAVLNDPAASPGARWWLLDSESHPVFEPPRGDDVALGSAVAAMPAAVTASSASAETVLPRWTNLEIQGNVYQLLQAPIADTGWRLAYTQPETIVPVSQQMSVKRVLALVGAVMVLALLGAWWVGRELAVPLARLREAHARVEQGDLAVRAPEDASDELGDLARSFNRMAEALVSADRNFRLVFERLRHSEQSFTALFESAPLPLSYSRSSENHRHSSWNQAWCRTFGYAREQVDGRTGDEIGMWVEVAERYRFGHSVLEKGRVDSFEAQLRHADGSIHTYELAGEMIDTLDGPMLMTAYVDVTEVRRAVAESQASQARLQAVFDASPVAVVVSDAGRGYKAVTANNVWYRQFLREPAQVLGKDGREMGLWAHDEDRTRMLEQLRNEGDYVSGFEAELVRGDGTRLLGRMAARQFRAGDDLLLALVQEDITERVRAEQALKESLTERERAQDALRELNETLEERVAARTRELSDAIEGLRRAQDDLVRAEKLASLGALVAGVAHELNTPIGNAVMMASTLADHQREFESAIAGGMRRSTLDNYLSVAREASQVLERNLKRAAELVGSFKQLAVDQSSYQRRRFDLAEVVQEVSLALSPTLRRSAVTLVDEAPSGLVLDSYPGPLGQVLVNLITNALVHAFDAGAAGRIEVRAERIDEGQLRLRLADNGRGIAERELGRIFDPFYTTRLGQGGSGLGLHIVYNLVTGLLGGRVEVHSTVGTGTEFVMDLPLSAPTA